jgi:outer membrane protein
MSKDQEMSAPRRALMRHGRWVAATAVLAGVIAAAPVANAQSLTDALAAAYLNNPQLLAERARTRSTDEAVPIALSNWRPRVEASGDLSRSYSNTTLNAPRVTTERLTTPRGAGVSLTQPLFRGFQTVNSVKQAENQVRAQRQVLLGSEQTVLLSAATVFMDVVRDEAVLQLNINNEQVLRRQLEAAQDRFRVGEITRTDVSQAEARLAGATADRITSEGQLESSRAAYQNVIGEAPGDLQEPTPLEGLPGSRDDAVDRARIQHPTVRAAEFNERAARDAVERVKGELLPNLSLTGSVARNYESARGIESSTSGTVGATLTVPLYQQGQVSARLRQAKQDAGRARLDLDSAVRDAARTATQAWETLATARARIKSITAQITAAEVALEGVQREAEVGSRTVLDVLDAEQELLDAKVNLVRARRDSLVASFAVKESVGDLTAKNLGLPVDYYDPEEHYKEVRDKVYGFTSSGEVPPSPSAASEGN